MYIVFPYELSLRDYYISFHLKEFRQKSLSKVFCASCRLPEVPCKGSGALAWAGGQQSRGAPWASGTKSVKKPQNQRCESCRKA